MRRVVLFAALACALAGFAGLAVKAADEATAEGEAKPKYDIKAVMKEAHGQKLLNKVVDGTASAEDKQKLLDLYLSLLENKPPKGDEAGWHSKSGAVVVAAAKVVVGRDGAVEELKTSTNCAACHKDHKGS